MAVYKAVFLKTRIKTDGSARIRIRVSHNQSHSYISTDMHIDSSQFSNKKGRMIKGPNIIFVNSRITTIIDEYQRKEISLGDKIQTMSAAELKEFLLRGKTKSNEINFIEFLREECPGLVEKESTGQNFIWLANSLESFIGPLLPVSNITPGFLKDYEKFLRERGVNKGVRNYMATLRSGFGKCRDMYNDEDNGIYLIPHYPFGGKKRGKLAGKKYVVPKASDHSKHHFLDEEEMLKFLTFKSDASNLQYARDMFMLSFFLIGIESIDLFNAPKPDRTGRLNFVRSKTGHEFSIKVTPEAKEIIRRYEGKNRLIDASERFSSQKAFMDNINRNLRGEERKNNPGVVGVLEIEKGVTTKWARHTWATWARNKLRIHKDDVALCLGHKDMDNQTTDIYHFDDYTIQDDSNRRVIDFLIGMLVNV